MCGFAGILGTKKSENLNALKKMVEIMHYRGPDQSDFLILEQGMFAHKRLSIIDLSTHSSQPMISTDKRFSLVFSGELYNYIELRKILLSKGHNFTTKSDTEVMLKSFIEFGEDALNRFIGMFSGCFYDNKTKTALLFRDNFGQKPIFYSKSRNNNFLFSTEIKGLIAGGIEVRPNLNSIARYLNQAIYDDDEETFFQDVKQLLPGEFIIITPDKKIKKKRWYNLQEKISPKENLKSLRTEIIDLIYNSTQLHMRSDVPVGLCLSGGLDSSALLTAISKTGNMTDNFTCLSLGFGKDFSEKVWINSATKQFNLNSIILDFTPEDFLSSLKPMMWHLESPIGGLMNCGFKLIFEKANELGITVLQDGTGLDEAFGGYQHHHNLFIAKAMIDSHPKLNSYVLDYMRTWCCTKKDVLTAAKRSINSKNLAIDGSSPIRKDVLSEEIKNFKSFTTNINFNTGNFLTDSLCNYLQVEKIPRNMKMKDRLSMAYSKELRLPFLDKRLIELGLSLPIELLFKDGLTKSVIREAFHGIMDNRVRLAQKRSIQAPQGKWLKMQPMKSYINSILSSKSFAQRGLFKIDACKKAYDDYCSGEIKNSFFIWQWINIEEWFRVFVDKSPILNKYYLNN